MASFMTTTSQVIFRRFDDVHVKLLLCLQDEIAQLEQELMGLENGSPVTSDGVGQKMKVMRELRRVVAEYGKKFPYICLETKLTIQLDHLFASWSGMQANKADQAVMRDLKEWLENPKTSAGAGITEGSREDLAWVEKSKDLSSVNLGNPKRHQA